LRKVSEKKFQRATANTREGENRKKIQKNQKNLKVVESPLTSVPLEGIRGGGRRPEGFDEKTMKLT
jgi:hypothetical protein